MSDLIGRGILYGTLSRGGGGVGSYNDLTNKPKINSTTIVGDQNGHYYGLMELNDLSINQVIDLSRNGSTIDMEFGGSHYIWNDLDFEGAAGGAAGARGMVPKPGAGDTGKFLSNEGWATIPAGWTPPDYSENEQNTGIKWKDGKDIFVKTIQATITSTSTTINTGLTIDTLVNFINSGNKTSGGVNIRFGNYYYDGGDWCNVQGVDNNIRLLCTSWFVGATVNITIYYTKS